MIQCGIVRVKNHNTNGLNMSTDSKSQGGAENPIAGIEPPKSRKKLWIFGGLGCLGLIAVICLVGAWAIYYFGIKPMQDFQRNTVDEAIVMPQVEDALGTPIEVGAAATPVQEGQQFVFRTPLTGPNGEATLVVKGTFDGSWTKDETYLEMNGEQIDLDTELLFNLDIDDGL